MNILKRLTSIESVDLLRYSNQYLFRLVRQLTNTYYQTSYETVMESLQHQKRRKFIFGRNIKKICFQQQSEKQNSFSQYVEHVHFNVTCPDITELASPLDSLKANRAIGSDNIQLELLMQIALGEHLQYILSSNVFGLIKFYYLKSQRVLLHYNLTECKNWRRIIFRALTKIIACIINTQLSDCISKSFKNEQTPFRTDISCILSMFYMRRLSPLQIRVGYLEQFLVN